MLRQSFFFVGVSYFLILLVMALWIRDIPNQYDPMTSTINDVIQHSSMGDPKYFATAAIDVAKNGWISPENQWVFNLWPPGFVLLEAAVIKLMGLDAPIILVLQILASLLFALVLVLLYRLLAQQVDRRVAFVLPLVIFIFPVSRVFLLQPIGLTLGESFSIGLFLIFILLTCQSAKRKSLISALIAGACLGLSAYFRSQFEIILMGLTGCGIVLLSLVWLTGFRKLFGSAVFLSTVKTVTVVLLVAHLVTVPWRIYHLQNHQSPQWVFTSGVTFGNSVKSSDVLEKAGGGFVVAGGGNLVCRIDSTTCDDVANAKQLFIKTLLQNPVEWYSLKYEVAGKYWFSSMENWSSISKEASISDWLINAVLLAALVLIVVFLLRPKVRQHELWPVLMWINISLFSSYFLIFTVQQFEARYFYFPKIAGLIMLIIILSLYFGSAKGSGESPQQGE